MLRRREALLRQVLLAGDVVLLLISYLAAYYVRLRIFPLFSPVPESVQEYAWVLWVIIPTSIIAFRWSGLYESGTCESLASTTRALVKGQVVAGLILLSSMYLMKKPEVSRLLLETYLGLSFLMLLGERTAVRLVLYRFSVFSSHNLWRVMVIGDGPQAQDYLRMLREHPHWGVQVVAMLSTMPTNGVNANGSNGNGANGDGNGHARLEPADWKSILQQYVVDEVTAVSQWYEAAATESLAVACAERGITFRMLVQMPPMQVGHYHVEDLGRGAYLVSLETAPHAPLALLIKRLIDIAGAIIGLGLSGLAYLWFAPRIRRESPGPVLFRQERVGQNGRRFTIYKFRTMYLEAEQRLKELLGGNEMKGPMFKIKQDPRVTPIGRLLRRHHIDELPQCWNVLKGQMSLVGTRPPTPNEVEKYFAHHFRRLAMKPGITGLWQLNGNGSVNDFEEVVKLDCEYIDNWSLGLDFKILAKTLVKVVRASAW
ncbi:MAG: sugar transferase [Candidatus Binataceae bacterium]